MESEIPASTSTRDGLGTSELGSRARHSAAVLDTTTNMNPSSSSLTLNNNPIHSRTLESFNVDSHDFGGKQHVMIGLTIAGVASHLLTTIYGLFHVDLFLRAYELPLPTYSLGSFVFSIINTMNDVAGAWLVDHVAMTRARSDMIGMSGCLFALLFLTPFFRWPRNTVNNTMTSSSNLWWDGVHFVTTMSLYDTLYSFTAILMGSVVTDNHSMTDKARVQFMASGKVVNLMSSFTVARIGLAIFRVDNLYSFRIFLVLLAVSVAIMFLVAQAMISGTSTSFMTTTNLWWRSKSRGSKQLHHRDDDAAAPTVSANSTTTTSTSSPSRNKKKRKLHWRRVVQDFWRHDNFRAWIGMEMLLEAQNTFCISFLKTFVDQLVLQQEEENGAGAGFSRGTCDWLLSMIRPLTQLVAIGTYIPIRRLGYPRVYSILFGVNIALSLLLLTLANESSTHLIIAFLLIYPVLTGAVQSAGFHLAMSDMVMELKRKHAMEGRYDEPSLAGLFMGANALMCKPMESILPILTATVLHRGENDKQKQHLFYLLAVPPLVCSCLQLLAWSRFDLTPKRTVKMRDELKKLHSREDSGMELLL
jgi:hypothetical protein